MKRIVSFLILVMLALTNFSPVFAQQTPLKDDDDVVKISTNLIQIDATVTDKKGNIIRDLTANDFEIYENDEKQPITNFSFVELRPVEAADSLAQIPKPDKNALVSPSVPVKLRPEQVRRTIALVVDDLGLSFANTLWIQKALKKFVDEQMEPGDLVAIIRTNGGIGALQQFTSDKQQLYAAIKKVRFKFMPELNHMSFAMRRSGSQNESAGNADLTDRATRNEQGLRDEGGLDLFSESRVINGSIGALNHVVRGMDELPGRKAVMFFSQGLQPTTQLTPTVQRALRSLTELANRSGAILYAVDPRGLLVPSFGGRSPIRADESFAGAGNSTGELDGMLRINDNLAKTQPALQFLSEESGGFAFMNLNDLNIGIQRVLNDQKGFYLLGYQPDEETFNPKTRSYNKLKVRLKRPGLKIRFRSGFFGMTDAEVKATPINPHAQMLNALTSPFIRNEIDLKLTTFFVDKPDVGPSMETFIHLDSDNLKFVEDKDGWQKVSFEVLAVLFGDNGTIVDTLNLDQTFKARDETLNEIRQKGLVYSLNVPIKKPGAYQMRFVIRDTATEKVGSANQFIEVPDLKKKRLTLSGIALHRSETANGANQKPANQLQTDQQRDIALRQFRPGSALQFAFAIYNAKTDKSNNNSNLVIQYRLFRDNKEIFTSAENPIVSPNPSGLQALSAGGVFTLDPKISPGEYVLQVIVKDTLATGKNSFAAQWVDFEVVK